MRSVFLVGFMAVGKSTVGRELADMIDLPFIDLDELVQSSADMSVAEIFTSEGEDGFRELERRVLGDVIHGEPAVVATGGGVPTFSDNLERMKRGGLVVALTAPLDESLARTSEEGSRPLLAQSPEQIRALYNARVPIYRQSHATLRTEGRDPYAVAEEVAALASLAECIPRRALSRSAVVALGGRSYPVICEPGSLAQLGALVRARLGAGCARVGLISDQNVEPLYGQLARAALDAAGFEIVDSVIPAGETSKSLEHYQRLSAEMIAGGLDRRSAIVALGGGVVGDIAGFVAATLYRGIPCVQVPTTILAMVDSAIGGKTGINTDAGKNLLGAFWQPSLVLADPEVLATLPVRERRAACGELFKYALLDGEDTMFAVEELAPELVAESLEASPEDCTEVVSRCAAIKSWIVSRDEREQSGERALLNLGHTVGHAIEASAGYGTLLHGEAVALGLLAAARISAALGLAEASLEPRIAEALSAAGLDTDLDRWLTEDVLDRIGVDKKRTGEQIRFITIREVGECDVTPLALDRVKALLRAGKAV